MSELAEVLKVIGDHPSLMYPTYCVFILSFGLLLFFLARIIYFISNSYLSKKVNKYIDDNLGDEWKNDLKVQIKEELDKKIKKEINSKFEEEKKIIYELINDKKLSVEFKKSTVALIDNEDEINQTIQKSFNTKQMLFDTLDENELSACALIVICLGEKSIDEICKLSNYSVPVIIYTQKQLKEEELKKLPDNFYIVKFKATLIEKLHTAYLVEKLLKV